jgi:hypothetical protein
MRPPRRSPVVVVGRAVARAGLVHRRSRRWRCRHTDPGPGNRYRSGRRHCTSTVGHRYRRYSGDDGVAHSAAGGGYRRSARRPDNRRCSHTLRRRSAEHHTCRNSGLAAYYTHSPPAPGTGCRPDMTRCRSRAGSADHSCQRWRPDRDCRRSSRGPGNRYRRHRCRRRSAANRRCPCFFGGDASRAAEGGYRRIRAQPDNRRYSHSFLHTAAVGRKRRHFPLGTGYRHSRARPHSPSWPYRGFPGRWEAVAALHIDWSWCCRCSPRCPDIARCCCRSQHRSAARRKCRHPRLAACCRCRCCVWGSRRYWRRDRRSLVRTGPWPGGPVDRRCKRATGVAASHRSTGSRRDGRGGRCHFHTQ